MAERPTKRPYARLELERRFLLEALPPGVEADDFERLDDLFIASTHLRLRQVHRSDGVWSVTKLGQKIVDPAAPADARRRLMTTIYLPESEASIVATMPGLRTSKRRYRLQEQGWTFSVDVWDEPSATRGVILAEVEAPSLDELARIALPTWAVREVTDAPRYTAIALARR